MEKSPQPLRNLSGAGIAATIAFLLYLLTSTIGVRLALSPVPTEGAAARLTVVVRSALLAIGTGATMIFAVVALGLILLTVQQLMRGNQD